MSGQLVMSLNETFIFLKRWAKNPLQLGSIAPSSKALSSFIARNAVLNENDFVIEIGGGTGAISRALLNSGIPASRLIVIELDPELAEFLKKSLPSGVHVIQGNAEKLDKIVPHEALGNVSTIISCLPMKIIPDHVQKNIIEACFRTMGKNGNIIQYTYDVIKSPIASQNLEIQNKRLGFIFRNLPPAVVWKYWR